MEKAMTYSDTDGTIRKRSGWLIPLGVFLVTAVLSALVLLFYLAPTAPNFLEEQASPTSRSDLVPVKVHDLHLWIPANYLQFESARQGGTRKDLALFAILPDMAGWSNWEASAFTGNTPDSPVVYLLIREEGLNLTEADRLARIYMSYVVNPRGTPGPFGLTQYTFREDSGYRHEDLFVGQGLNGPIVMRCVRFSPEVPSPGCLRDLPIAHSVALSYRFKREHLARWHEIGEGIAKLITVFKIRPKTQADTQAQPRP